MKPSSQQHSSIQQLGGPTFSTTTALSAKHWDPKASALAPVRSGMGSIVLEHASIK
jgi:hypothetical protein